MGRQPRKSDSPTARLGVYKRLSDVPHRYRLHHHADAYAGRDVWAEFCAEEAYAQGAGAAHEQEVDRVGRRWKAFMADRERHHALALPEDVDAWSAELRDRFSIRCAYEHWSRVESFYDWLMWHTEHPHLYNPAMLAAAGDGATRVLWECYRVPQNEKRRTAAGAETNE